VLFRDFGSFGNGCSNICALSDTDANLALMIANDDQSAETEAATALYYTSNAVDVNDALIKFFLLFYNWTPAITAWWTTTVTPRGAAMWSLSLYVSLFGHS
jgi:hypothetical protein